MAADFRTMGMSIGSLALAFVFIGCICADGADYYELQGTLLGADGQTPLSDAWVSVQLDSPHRTSARPVIADEDGQFTIGWLGDKFGGGCSLYFIPPTMPPADILTAITLDYVYEGEFGTLELPLTPEQQQFPYGESHNVIAAGEITTEIATD